MSLMVETRPETRQAKLQVNSRRFDEAGNWFSDGFLVEDVFVWTQASGERALCEHRDGTMTFEDWSNVRFIHQRQRFELWNWEDA